MSGESKSKWQRNLPVEEGLGRMLVMSLLLHTAVVVLMVMPFYTVKRPEPRPVYYVDLSQMPVADPQAGRPEAPAPRQEAAARPTPLQPAPAPPLPESKPVEVVRPKPPEPKPEPKPAPKPEPKPEPKPAPKPEPKPEPKPAPKPAPDPRQAQQAELDRRMAELREQARRQQEIDGLKDRLAALAAQDTRSGSPIPDAPLGMPDGRGTQAGASQDAWLQAFLKEQWNLSRYQLSRRDLEARTLIIYDARGHLLDYRFLKESGDRVFDDSVRSAILRERKLPFEPGRRWEQTVIFNLKDLLE